MEEAKDVVESLADILNSESISEAGHKALKVGAGFAEKNMRQMPNKDSRARSASEATERALAVAIRPRGPGGGGAENRQLRRFRYASLTMN